MADAGTTLRSAMAELESLPRCDCCKGCGLYRAALNKMLRKMAYFITLSEPAIDAERTSHHEATAYSLAQGTAAASHHSKFKKGASCGLPPAVERLMREDMRGGGFDPLT